MTGVIFSDALTLDFFHVTRDICFFLVFFTYVILLSQLHAYTNHRHKIVVCINHLFLI